MTSLDDAGHHAGPAEVPARRPAPVAGEPPVLLANLLAELIPSGRPVSREEAVSLLRRHLGRIQNRVQQVFEAHEISGLPAARWLASLTDTVMVGIRAYTDAVLPPAPGEKPWALVATGGYGRGVLAPFSDIDLLFLTDAGMGARGKQSVEFMLYLLWDLGLKVGHATRSRHDCLVDAKSDATVLTALLDARHIAGDEQVFQRFAAAFRDARAEWGLTPFLIAKRAERQQRHARYGESPFLVEPHVKEGRGGLRDLQTLYWLARYAFNVQRMPELVGPHTPGGGLLTAEEARAIRRAWDFFWTVRFHLHIVTGRAEERLTFDLQPVVGARMGYTRHGLQDGVERFMKHFFLMVRDVARFTRILEPAIERASLGPPAVVPASDKALTEAGFALADGKVIAAPGHDFTIDPVLMLRIFRMARDRGLDIHPLAFRAIVRHARHVARLRGEKEASAEFLDLPAHDQRGGAHLPPAAGLAAHRRADAVRHLSRLHRR